MAYNPIASYEECVWKSLPISDGYYQNGTYPREENCAVRWTTLEVARRSMVMIDSSTRTLLSDEKIFGWGLVDIILLQRCDRVPIRLEISSSVCRHASGPLLKHSRSSHTSRPAKRYSECCTIQIFCVALRLRRRTRSKNDGGTTLSVTELRS
jgi:hypothetical protein